ncbi:38308_t:CDS:2, partial [Gigaspora margarita]
HKGSFVALEDHLDNLCIKASLDVCSLKEVQDNKFLEEKMFKIKKLLNIYIDDFMNDLDKIVFTTNFESSEEEDINIQNNNVKSNVDESNWDSKKKAKSMLD